MTTYSIDEVAKALGLNHWIVRYWFDHLHRRAGRPRHRQPYEKRVLSSRDFEKAREALTGNRIPTVLVCGGSNFTSITVELKRAFQSIEVKAVSLNALQEVAQSCRPCCIIIDAAETTQSMVLKTMREVRTKPWGRAIRIHSLFTKTDDSIRIATHTTRNGLIKELKSQFQVNS